MMMTSDPIADMLTRIRNANTAKHDTVDIPASKIKVGRVDVFGVDLYAVGLGEKIEAMAKELFAGPGAVRKTLHKYTLAR